MEVEMISTRQISMVFRRASSQNSWFSGFRVSFFIFWIRILIYLNLGVSRSTQGASKDHRGSIWRQLGVSRDHFGGILWWSDFSRNPKIMTNQLVECFPWQFSMKLGGIDPQLMPGHFPTLGYSFSTVFSSKKQNNAFGRQCICLPPAGKFRALIRPGWRMHP